MHNTLTTDAPRRFVREIARLTLLAAVIFSPALLMGQTPAEFAQLVDAVKASPGCLGVEVARTGSGKQALFAWFEDKQAVLRWYASDVHQRAMRSAPPKAFTGRPPLADVPDGTGPILIVASVGPGQIAIELYAPLPGGIAAGGRFSPDGVKVPGLLVVPRSAPRP